MEPHNRYNRYNRHDLHNRHNRHDLPELPDVPDVPDLPDLPDLNHLFSTAVSDLPELPDQVPAALRIHRRRTATARAGAVAAAAALVVGVGTLTIASPWGDHHSATTVRVAGAPSTAGVPTIRAWLPGPASVVEFGPGKRAAAPNLSGVTLNGEALASSYTGHVTVLVIWGSWCAPCRAEAPTLAETSQKQRPTGVRFLGIDVSDDNAAALAFQTSFGISYPSLRDPDETLAHTFNPPVVPADSVPVTVIVDSTGKVAATIVGVATSTQLDGQITYALGTGIAYTPTTEAATP